MTRPPTVTVAALLAQLAVTVAAVSASPPSAVVVARHNRFFAYTMFGEERLGDGKNATPTSRRVLQFLMTPDIDTRDAVYTYPTVYTERQNVMLTDMLRSYLDNREVYDEDAELMAVSFPESVMAHGNHANLVPRLLMQLEAYAPTDCPHPEQNVLPAVLDRRRGRLFSSQGKRGAG